MAVVRSIDPGAVLWNDRSDFPLDWNGPTDRPFDAFPDEAKARPIIELLEAVVRRYPERIALAAEASITYAEMWRALAGWAERIAGATAPGDLVGILAPVSTAFPIAMLACLAAGRPFVALDPDNPGEWIARVLDDARPSLLLVMTEGHGAAAPIPAAPAPSISTTMPETRRRAGGRPAWLPTRPLASSSPRAAPASPRASSIRSAICSSA